MYSVVQEQGKTTIANIEAEKIEIAEKVENMRVDFDADVEITSARVDVREDRGKCYRRKKYKTKYNS